MGGGRQSVPSGHVGPIGRDVRRFFVALAGFSGFKGPFGALAPAYTISFELLYYAIWGLAMTAALGRARRALAHRRGSQRSC